MMPVSPPHLSSRTRSPTERRVTLILPAHNRSSGQQCPATDASQRVASLTVARPARRRADDDPMVKGPAPSGRAAKLKQVYRGNP